MTTRHTIETFQSDVLVERRELDLATNTFTRRDGGGVIVETRPLTAGETAQLNAKAAKAARDAAFGLARADVNSLPGNSPTKRALMTILDELERLR